MIPINSPVTYYKRKGWDKIPLAATVIEPNKKTSRIRFTDEDGTVIVRRVKNDSLDIKPLKVPKLTGDMKKVFDMMTRPLTCQQIADALGITTFEARLIIKELLKRNRIREIKNGGTSGIRLVRKDYNSVTK